MLDFNDACEANSEGLVYYPRTQAPSNGSVAITAECAVNAHTTNTSTLNVNCAYNGSWFGQTPQCECDEGYINVDMSRLAK